MPSEKIKCFFCGEDNPEVLEVHHIVPRSLGIPGSEKETIVVCANCHRKLHYIYRILFKYLGINYNGDSENENKERNEDKDIADLEKFITEVVYIVIRKMELEGEGPVTLRRLYKETDRLGLSRPAVGRSLKRLEEQGRIERERGTVYTIEHAIPLSKHVVTTIQLSRVIKELVDFIRTASSLSPSRCVPKSKIIKYLSAKYDKNRAHDALEIAHRRGLVFIANIIDGEDCYREVS